MLVKAEDYKIQNRTPFIVIDGVNGAGKSTLQRKIAQCLSELGIKNITTREPGATELGKEIRPLLLSSRPEKMNQLSELFLFAADRAEHVDKVITPTLKSGVAVISDRYYYSTIAFQGYGRGINRNIVEAINTIAIAGQLPDLLIILDLDPIDGIKRNKATVEKSSQSEGDKFEDEEVAFQYRLRTGFLELAKRVKEPAVIIDANRSPEEVYASVQQIFERSFK